MDKVERGDVVSSRGKVVTMINKGQMSIPSATNFAVDNLENFRVRVRRLGESVVAGEKVQRLCWR